MPLSTGFSFHFSSLPNSYRSYGSSETPGTPFISCCIISPLPWVLTCDPFPYADSAQTTWSSAILQYRLAIYIIHVDSKFPILNLELYLTLATFLSSPRKVPAIFFRRDPKPPMSEIFLLYGYHTATQIGNQRLLAGRISLSTQQLGLFMD